MLIETPISLGELIDKISILIIKKKNIKNSKKIAFIENELKILRKTLRNKFDEKKLDKHLKELVRINTKLWNIEDNIRDCERKKKFDQKFIDLARSVYFTNDERSKIKLKINKIFRSELVEVKSYKKY